MSRGPNETGPRRATTTTTTRRRPAAQAAPAAARRAVPGDVPDHDRDGRARRRTAGQAIAPIRDGLPYSLPLMFILLCHELGHYIVARLHGVPASLPYFIPLPPGLGLGTLGAVIGMRKVDDRSQAADRRRRRRTARGARRRDSGPRLRADALRGRAARERDCRRGTRSCTPLLKWIVKGAWLPNGAARTCSCIRPRTAAWAGLLVTMINLLPIGQLDGGHVATAYFGNRYNRFAERLRRLLPVGAVVVFFWVLHATAAGGGERLAAAAGDAHRDDRGDALAGLVPPGRADAPDDGRRESPARRRQAAAAQPARRCSG